MNEYRYTGLIDTQGTVGKTWTMTSGVLTLSLASRDLDRIWVRRYIYLSKVLHRKAIGQVPNLSYFINRHVLWRSEGIRVEDLLRLFVGAPQRLLHTNARTDIRHGWRELDGKTGTIISVINMNSTVGVSKRDKTGMIKLVMAMVTISLSVSRKTKGYYSSIIVPLTWDTGQEWPCRSS